MDCRNAASARYLEARPESGYAWKAFEQKLGRKKRTMDIDAIINAIGNGRVRITDHADEEAVDDGLTYEEIYYSAMHGEVIEDYPTDKPYPSCLILGKNFSDEPIHSVWAHNPQNLWAVLITVYRPDPRRWVDWKVRVTK